MPKSPEALVLIAHGTEEMEAVITADVLRRAGILVTLAGLDGPAPVECSRGVRLLPDVGLSEVEDRAVDAIVLPGGKGGADRFAASDRLGALLRRHLEAGRLVAAICAAPIALVTHDLCRGHAMTCHPSVRSIVFPHASPGEGLVVADRNLITSQGPGTTFLFALSIVTRLLGEEVAKEVAEPMMLPPSA